eukprot:10731414-Ditylum_brightwellii.AAC.1
MGTLKQQLLPSSYYKEDNTPKQKRHNDLQGVKWKSHTGQLPFDKKYWQDENDEDDSSAQQQ